MEIKTGIAVSPGISIAPSIVLRDVDLTITRHTIPAERVEQEIARFDGAVVAVVAKIEHDIEEVGDEFEIARQVLTMHRELVRDRALRKRVVQLIEEEHRSAEYSLSSVIRGYYARLQGTDSEYFSERIHDLTDIERKLLQHLLGKAADEPTSFEGEVNIVAHNLTPSETAALDKSKVKGFAIDVGGRTSHSAIMARALQIPAVVALKDISGAVVGGEAMIIDGHAGIVIIDPDEETLDKYARKSEYSRDFYRSLQEEVQWPAETVDGYEIRIAANIELPEEIEAALEWGARGIGLYRTEFLYEDGTPDEATHLRTYRRAINALGGRELVLRTLDAGADKFHDEAVGFEEPNPFLGCRSIRLCLEKQELFKDQIRAVLKASPLGPVKLMLPMVSSIDEVLASKLIIGEVQAELERDGVEFRSDIPVGIMVEVPSIAMMSDRVAQEVDFFSIGTNDLVQYCLAVDRVNEAVAHLYQPAHPAILRMIKMVIDAAEAAAIPVSICGEMCSEPVYTVLLIGLGLRNFSVSPISIPTVKRVVRQVTMSEAFTVARECLACDRAIEAQRILEERVRGLLPDFD